MYDDIQHDFKARLRAGTRLLGTFLKTPGPHATEIVAGAGFDFVVIDAEHAPFGPVEIDLMLLAARAAGIAALVRVQSADPAGILQVLDCGAAGILVPHVASAAMLEGVIRASRYDGGTRGFSNSPRAGLYGARGIRAHIEVADRAISVLAMIEDLDAIDRLDQIFAVEGLAGAFIGRGDLTAALGLDSTQAPEIQAIVAAVADSARRHGVPLLAHVGAASGAEVDWLVDMGVTGLIVASDQGLLRQAALANRAAFGST